MLSTVQINNLREAAKSAYECEKQSQVPCELTLAQWALESGWGSKTPGNNCFGIKYYEGAPGKQQLETIEWFTIDQFKVWLKMVEGRSAYASGISDGPKNRYVCQDFFATFPTLTDCFIKHCGMLLKGYYANCLGTFRVGGNLPQYIQCVSASYATDPTYSNKILQVIHMPEVLAALQEVRGSHEGAVEA